MFRKRVYVKALLVAVLIVLGSATLRPAAKLELNLKMLALTRQATVRALTLCDGPEDMGAGVWHDYQQILEDHGATASRTRDNRLIAFYNQDNLTPNHFLTELEGTVGADTFAYLYSSMALDCADTPIPKRVDWADLAERSAQDGNRVRVLRQIAAFYFQERMWPQALPVYEELVAKQPGDCRTLQRLAMVYRALDMHQQATFSLRSSLECPDVDRITSLVLLGNSLFRLGDHDQALATLAQAEQAFQSLGAPHPRSHLIFYYQGLVREGLGDKEHALQLYATAADLEPAHDASLIGLIQLAAELGNYPVASEAADRLSPTLHTSESLLCTLLQVTTETGEADDANALKEIIDGLHMDCVLDELED